MIRTKNTEGSTTRVERQSNRECNDHKSVPKEQNQRSRQHDLF